MSAEKITVARPYAKAAFEYAKDNEQLDQWSEMLNMVAQIAVDEQFTCVEENPKLTRTKKADLLIELCGSALNLQAQNFVRLLVQNGRFIVMPEVFNLYEGLRKDHQGTLDVYVTSALPFAQEQELTLVNSLQAKLGRSVSMIKNEDPSLLGGVIIRAGDLVIDGSIKGQISRLAAELGI